MTTQALAPEPTPFDLASPLPSGVTLLEASAGTGKTYTIAALVARYVAEGTPLDRLLVVTFTRMATSELRERVRQRLVAAADALGEVLAGGALEAKDLLLTVLADGSEEKLARRRERLARAVAEFDAATIETIHGFCLHVLAGLGVAGDVERGVTLVEEVPDLLEEVVDDLYVRRFAQRADPPPFTRSEALRIGREVLANPAATIVPEDNDGPSAVAMRGRLAHRVRSEVERRKRAAGLLTYDDLLSRLDGALADGGRGEAVAHWLRSRYAVALVDEFQDTDLVQWDIMRRAFGSRDSTLVLIGDPKQAIYAFRGADVYSYLRAAEEAKARATLSVNWRSDQGLLDALDALFSSSQLGHPGIVYRRVTAAPANLGRRLVGAGTPLRVRVVDRDDCGLTNKGYARTDPARALVAADVAVEVVTLLGSGATVVQPTGEAEPFRPAHLAVLVRTNKQAAMVRDALQEAGVPAVTYGTESVFESGAASNWLQLLEALERPTSQDRASAAALTPFVGWSAKQVATAGPEDWEELQWLLHRWASVLRRHGVAALMTEMSASRQLPGRLLAEPGGERALTDLRHVAELLHTAARGEHLGSTALTAWLRRRIGEAAQEATAEDQSRRLESDAEAVQVLTVHRSKGLEFPVVFCPYLWDFPEIRPAVPVFHDPARDDRRVVDVGGPDGPGFDQHRRLDRHEQRGEDLRLMYVALTRARHQAVVWWAATWDSRNSALSRLVFDKEEGGMVPPEGSTPPTDAEARARFEALVGASGGQISVERVDHGRPRPQWPGNQRGADRLERAVFERSLDEEWRRTSYSGLTAAAHDEVVATEPEHDVLDDESLSETGGAIGPDGDDGTVEDAWSPLLLGDLPGGIEVGTVVHRVLESVDFAAPDRRTQLRAGLERELAWRTVDLGPVEEWVEGLAAVLETPLGRLLDERRLCDLSRADRLDELGFELPLAGGDTPSGDLVVDDVARVLAEHAAPGDPLEGYAERLGDRRLARALRGYLTGSLDLVLRLPGGRYAVVDYKTNRLTPAGRPARIDDYGRQPLADEMFRAHYPLQALLYLVALHRYLRWRLPGYDPDRHLAGAHYLFVRGMSSPAFPVLDGQPPGVWSWQPPGRLVGALSDLFDRGGRR